MSIRDFPQAARAAITPGTARALTLAGLAATLASPWLAWTFTPLFPGNLTLYGDPGGSQIVTLVCALVAAVFTAGVLGVRVLAPAGAVRALRAASLAALSTTWVTVGAIAITLGGAVNVEPGGWLALLATAVLAAGAHALPEDAVADPRRPRALPRPVEILVITVVFLAAMYAVAFGIMTESAEEFLAYLPAALFGGRALVVSGLGTRLSALTARNRTATAVATLATGAPTLRLHADYLAIVTLGFGEIFRITVNNLDGNSGPSLTNGPNGINAVPNLEILGFDCRRS